MVDDFVAELKYLTTEEGGRKTPAYSGYRTNIKFPFSDYLTSGQQRFIDRDIVFPGETIDAKIKIIAVDVFANSLTEGLAFVFGEGRRIVGTGKINKILNVSLQKHGEE